MQKWKRAEPTTVHRVGFRVLVDKTFVLPNGKTETYTTIASEGADNIAVIAITPSNKVVVAPQFRVGPEKIFDELPGGGVERGESLEAAAKRELREETGYTTDEQLEYLGKVCVDAYTNATNHYFLAKNCYKAGSQNTDDTEFIHPQEISITTLFDNAKNYKMSDSAGVLLAFDYLKKLANDEETD